MTDQITRPRQPAGSQPPWQTHGHASPEAWVDYHRNGIDLAEFTNAGWTAGKVTIATTAGSLQTYGFTNATTGLGIYERRQVAATTVWVLFVAADGQALAHLPTASAARAAAVAIADIVDWRSSPDLEHDAEKSIAVLLAIEGVIAAVAREAERDVERIRAFAGMRWNVPRQAS